MQLGLTESCASGPVNVRVIEQDQICVTAEEIMFTLSLKITMWSSFDLSTLTLVTFITA